MTKEEKQFIADRLATFCQQQGSQNKAATKLSGISVATINKILKGKWETVADEMFNNLIAQLGGKAGNNATGWQIAATGANLRMTFVLQQAQQESLVFAVVGEAGCGKTEAIRQYVVGTPEAYHLCCSEYWNRRTFMQKLLQTMGVDSIGSTVSEMMEDIIDHLQRCNRPLVVLDEADKLSDQVLYFFISLYNALSENCGIVLCATDYLEKRIKRGLRLKKKGYEEIYSRIGRKFVALQLINTEDIAAVCRLNGIADDKTILEIARTSDNDLRRVKRAVWVAKQNKTITDQE